MSRRLRAAAFAIVAALCAVASAAIAASYRDGVDEQLGELRAVAVTASPLAAGRALDRKTLKRGVELREVPARFLPPDALADPAAAVGRKPLAPIPAGSYLLASMLRERSGGGPPEPRLASDVSPVQITVTGAGALAASGPAAGRVDVVVAGEPVTGGPARVRVAAEDVRLIAVEPASPGDAAAGGDSWAATLALTREQALKLIEAENFARELRLIPSG